MRQMCLRHRFRIENLLRGLINIKTTRTGRDVDSLILQGDNKNIHKVPMHTTLARGWIPSRSCQNFQTSQLVFITVQITDIGGNVEWQKRALSRSGHYVIRRSAVNMFTPVSDIGQWTIASIT